MHPRDFSKSCAILRKTFASITDGFNHTKNALFPAFSTFRQLPLKTCVFVYLSLYICVLGAQPVSGSEALAVAAFQLPQLSRAQPPPCAE